MLTSWNPDLFPDEYQVVYALEADGEAIHAGGALCGAAPRVCNVIAIDASSGAVSDQDFGISGSVNALAVGGNTLYVGGNGFSALQIGSPVSTLDPEVTNRPGLDADQNEPNPFSNESTLRFRLQQRSPTRVELFDAAGRLVAVPLDSRELAAGPHAVKLNASRLPPGVYFCRITAGTRSSTQKTLVVH
jgi:hypothetical protein